ncbi:hypothetical protein [Deminuibacter soli]|uniref:Uncharacterized protein n=1 Tax=Deminuibacter soli TaxID=2291815 RepID=A0A3E1NLY5_9BACT|nr:hypothetical protein [Deminuibacter soli]RFM28949.1 hypothetical protein DXN05_09295 [Deminuibacter soli]
MRKNTAVHQKRQTGYIISVIITFLPLKVSGTRFDCDAQHHNNQMDIFYDVLLPAVLKVLPGSGKNAPQKNS